VASKNTEEESARNKLRYEPEAVPRNVVSVRVLVVVDVVWFEIGACFGWAPEEAQILGIPLANNDRRGFHSQLMARHGSWALPNESRLSCGALKKE